MNQNGPRAPEDEKIKMLIETLAKNVAEHGKEFEQKFKEKQGKKSNPPAFLFQGKEFNDFYRYRVIDLSPLIFLTLFIVRLSFIKQS